MRAKDLMSHPVVTVTPRHTARDAAALLARHGFTALPVVDDDGDLVGIVTEADVMRERIPPDPRRSHYRTEHIGHIGDPPQTVGEIMTTGVVAMTSTTDVAEAVRGMLQGRLRAIPVVDPAPVASRRLVGILTRRDLMSCICRDDALIAADVRHRLEIYGGPGRWTVDVKDGHVEITDLYDDPTDLHVANVLAAAVPGIASVHTVSTSGAIAARC
jgi:CBS domain-containing protein